MTLQVSPSTNKQCGNCFQPASTEKMLKTCGKCKTAYYCSLECQKTAWPTHKKVCQPPSIQPKVMTSPSVKPSLEMKGASSPDTTTCTDSGYLRFLHIWLDAHQRNLTGSGKEVMVLGPGSTMFQGIQHCPQMEEALRLWDNSHFTVLDCNPTVFATLDSLDPEVSHTNITKTFEINKVCTQALKQPVDVIKSQLTKRTFLPNRITKIMFNIGIDDPSTLPQAKVILVTFSLFYPMWKYRMDPDRELRINLFSQYLAKLQPGGVLYVDHSCMDSLMADSLGPLVVPEPDQSVLNDIRTLLAEIQDKLGMTFSCQEIEPVIEPLAPHFVPPRPTLNKFLTAQVSKNKVISTATVYAFTRK